MIASQRTRMKCWCVARSSNPDSPGPSPFNQVHSPTLHHTPGSHQRRLMAGSAIERSTLRRLAGPLDVEGYPALVAKGSVSTSMSGTLGRDSVATDPFGHRLRVSPSTGATEHRSEGDVPRRFRPVAAARSHLHRSLIGRIPQRPATDCFAASPFPSVLNYSLDPVSSW